MSNRLRKTRQDLVADRGAGGRLTTGVYVQKVDRFGGRTVGRHMEQQRTESAGKLEGGNPFRLLEYIPSGTEVAREGRGSRDEDDRIVRALPVIAEIIRLCKQSLRSCLPATPGPPIHPFASSSLDPSNLIGPGRPAPNAWLSLCMCRTVGVQRVNAYARRAQLSSSSRRKWSSMTTGAPALRRSILGLMKACAYE